MAGTSRSRCRSCRRRCGAPRSCCYRTCTSTWASRSLTHAAPASFRRGRHGRTRRRRKPRRRRSPRPRRPATSSRGHMRLSRLIRTAVALVATAVFAHNASLADPRPPDAMNGAELKIALRKLQVMGTALYVGAHPDDENTAMLAWLSNGRMVRTAYLSMTRGDGGQNLLGREIGEPLGVIRTQELLAARNVDGAEQFFTRALDFGFSKNADETLDFWGHDRILADAVWVIRELEPDVIVTRFRPDSTAGHGHHIASSILAGEAFTAAADPKRYPEQLRYVKPWQAKRLVWNAYRFGSTAVDTTPGRVRIDLGAFDPLLGRSYTELAGESRSKHQSQGAGTPERRGEWVNTFENRSGEPAKQDLFEGVDLTWARIPGGAKVGTLLKEAEKAFDPDHPSAILPKLIQAHAVM